MRTPPTLALRPNFSNFHALCIHLQQELQQLVNPQTNVLGWFRLVMSQPMYLLISSNAFRIPNDPGPIPVYFRQGTPIVNDNGTAVVDSIGNPTYLPLDCATQATINTNFARARNYWLSYQNVKQACYNVLHQNIDYAFKVSDDTNLTGWNPAMEIRELLDQMVTRYGRPTPNALLQNNTLFCCVYLPTEAPEALFCWIKKCQEIQTLGDDPHTPTQLLNNVIRLLLRCGLYQRDSEEWDCKTMAKKIWINLKPFIQEAYQRRLTATNNTTGQHGYVQKAYAIFAETDIDEDNDINDDVATVTTHLLAMTTQSQLTAATAAEGAVAVTAAINQLSANQSAIMQMMAYANMTRADKRPQTRIVWGGAVQYPSGAAPTPVPITQFNIPNFQQGGQGHGGRRPGGGRGGAGCQGGRTPQYNPGGGIPPFVPGTGQYATQGNQAPTPTL